MFIKERKREVFFSLSPVQQYKTTDQMFLLCNMNNFMNTAANIQGNIQLQVKYTIKKLYLCTFFSLFFFGKYPFMLAARSPYCLILFVIQLLYTIRSGSMGISRILFCFYTEFVCVYSRQEQK